MPETKSAMTDKERVEALLRRERPDRVPIAGMGLGFSTVYSRASVADCYNNPPVSYEAQKKAAHDFGWVFMPLLVSPAWVAWEMGGEMKWPSGDYAQAPTVTRHPVEKPEDVANLKVPDSFEGLGMVPYLMEFYSYGAKEELDNKPWKFISYTGLPFTNAGKLIGVDSLSKWMLKKPDIVHQVLRITTDFLIKFSEYVAGKFGTDRVLPFGGEPTSANQIISPDQFEKFALPYIQEMHAKLLAMGHKSIFCHICGEHNLNLPHWAKIPMGDPGLVSFGHEIDIEKAAEYFPNDIIVGNLEPAIVQTGTVDEVYNATRKIIEKGKNLSTGFIFAPGCELPPMASPDNVMAMTRAVEDFGWYD